MVAQQDIQPLLDMGFKPVELDQLEDVCKGWHGTLAPEPFSAHPHHYNPKFRMVSVMPYSPHGGSVYVTSDLTGIFRGYRCRRVEEGVRMANVSAYAETADEAVRKWVQAFRAHMKGIHERAV